MNIYIHLFSHMALKSFFHVNVFVVIGTGISLVGISMWRPGVQADACKLLIGILNNASVAATTVY